MSALNHVYSNSFRTESEFF